MGGYDIVKQDRVQVRKKQTKEEHAEKALSTLLRKYQLRSLYYFKIDIGRFSRLQWMYNYFFGILTTFMENEWIKELITIQCEHRFFRQAGIIECSNIVLKLLNEILLH